MIRVNHRVNRKGTDHPIGIVEKINNLNGLVTVRWGIQDRQTVREDIPLDQLEENYNEVVSYEDLPKLKVDESGKVYLKDEE